MLTARDIEDIVDLWIAEYERVNGKSPLTGRARLLAIRRTMADRMEEVHRREDEGDSDG